MLSNAVRTRSRLFCDNPFAWRGGGRTGQHALHYLARQRLLCSSRAGPDLVFSLARAGGRLLLFYLGLALRRRKHAALVPVWAAFLDGHAPQSRPAARKADRVSASLGDVCNGWLMAAAACGEWQRACGRERCSAQCGAVRVLTRCAGRSRSS